MCCVCFIATIASDVRYFFLFDTRANIAGGSKFIPTSCSLKVQNAHTEMDDSSNTVPASATVAPSILAQTSHGDAPLKVVNAVPPAITCLPEDHRFQSICVAETMTQQGHETRVDLLAIRATR